MSRPIEEIEADYTKAELQFLDSVNDLQLMSSLIGKMNVLIAELDQDNKEAGEQ